jgi:hypothetical protein
VTALDPGDIDRLAVESRRRQGLPDYVEDPATIARVVRLILAGGLPSGPPDNLDARGVEDVAALQAGVQDHPFDHRRQDRAAPTQPPRLPGLPQRPLAQPDGALRGHRAGYAEAQIDGGRSRSNDVAGAEGI